MAAPPQFAGGEDQKRHIEGGFDQKPVPIPYDLRPDRDQVEQKTRRRQPDQGRRGSDTGENDQPGEVPRVVWRQQRGKGGGEQRGTMNIDARTGPPEGDPSGERGEQTSRGGDVSQVRDAAERQD